MTTNVNALGKVSEEEKNCGWVVGQVNAVETPKLSK
jgi:DNA-binding FrmR family transcriptional regulator